MPCSLLEAHRKEAPGIVDGHSNKWGCAPQRRLVDFKKTRAIIDNPTTKDSVAEMDEVQGKGYALAVDRRLRETLSELCYKVVAPTLSTTYTVNIQCPIPATLGFGSKILRILRSAVPPERNCEGRGTAGLGISTKFPYDLAKPGTHTSRWQWSWACCI